MSSLFNAMMGAAGAAGGGGFSVDNSMVLDSSGSDQYLSRTTGTCDSETECLLSVWLKATKDNSSKNDQSIIGAGPSSNNGLLRWEDGASGMHIGHHNGSTWDWEWSISTANYARRDPHAFQHWVFSFKANDGSPFRIWKNGTEITSESYITKTSSPTTGDKWINLSDVTQTIGRRSVASGYYFDGYLAEVVVADGLSIQGGDFTIGSFGEADATSGIWKPIDVSSLSLGSQGFYLPFSDSTRIGLDASGNVTENQIPQAAGSVIGDAWNSGSGPSLADIFADNGTGTGGATNTGYIASGQQGYAGKDWGADNKRILTRVDLYPVTDSGFVGPPASSDVVIRIWGSDSAPASFSDGTQLYTTGTFTDQTTVLSITSGITGTTAYRYHWVSVECDSATGQLFLGEVEFYEDGVQFEASGSPTQSSDTPTNNFATLTPLWKGSSVTLAGGNLSYDTSTNFQAAVASMGVTSGKWYWEVDVGSTVSAAEIGFTDELGLQNILSVTDHFDNHGWSFETNTGNTYDHTTSSVAYGSAISSNDVVGVAIDLDNGKSYWSVNGTWQNSGDPAAQTNPAHTNLPTDGTMIVPGLATTAAATAHTFNFGSQSPNSGGNADGNGYGDFDYAPPSGFLAICTANLYANAAPAVADVSDGFVQTTNTEDNIVSSLASLRSAHTNYIEIYKNLDAVEEWVVKFSDDTGNFMSFNDNDAKNTFPTLSGSNVWLGASLRVGSTYGVYTTTVSHTNGSDTNSAHGLSSSTGRYACIVKRESTGGGDWYLDHPSLTSAYNIVFGSASAAVEQNSTVYADVDATNGTVLSAAPTGTYRIIVFAEVPGFLELPDWTGNSSSDGPLVGLALSPTFGIFKTYKTTSGDWIVQSVAVDDNTAAGNPRNTRLILNGTQSDSSDYAVDYGANFFKARDSQNAINASVPMLGILIGQASFGSSPATAK
jgi:hypothetical protein